MNIDFENQSPKAILSKICKLNKQISGHEKFLVVSMIIAKGKRNTEISLNELQQVWKKSSCGPYYSAFYSRAETNDWVFPLSGRNRFTLTEEGIKRFNILSQNQTFNLKEIRKVGALMVVNKKATFSFDVFLREILSKAKHKILIADSYVDETLIDNYLGAVSSGSIIKVLYGNDYGSFIARAKRHKTQFSKFDFLQYKDMHDRFVIIDDIGYVLGPSIKDAATNSPALVVALNSEESKLLESFFMELWNQSK